MEQQKKGPLSSLIPALIVGAVMIFALQLFQGPSKKKTPPPAPGGGQAGKQTQPGKAPKSKFKDFEFRKSRVKDGSDDITVDTGAYLVVLSRTGGRIKKFYLKSHDELILPPRAIASSKDSMAKKHSSLELTRYNGMDFQPHLFWRDQYTGYFSQIKDPPLNHALFKGGEIRRDSTGKIIEVTFKLPMRFSGKRLELIKVYRFVKDEHFFRQITAIRNRERREFTLSTPGPLFFKTFGDIGPLEEKEDPRSPSTRFYFYGGELFIRNTNPAAAGGCGGGCGSNTADKLSEITKPNSLEFFGSTSRYFYAYSKFLSPKNDVRNNPDGIIMVPNPGSSGRDTATIIFDNFRLAPGKNAPLHLTDLQPGPGDSARTVPGGARARIARLQRERGDALIIDNMVYLGVRSDEAHAFKQENVMTSEFGLKEADASARKPLFSSSYFALFSSLKDIVVALMRWMNKYIGNYGWTIIIIAMSLKLVTFPLNNMQAKSMKKMQAIKPDIDRLNEVYKDNPQEKQKKMMEIYKKHQINPAKGCFPILIQMPIFVALFSAFSEAVELWQSPFILWMTDLSQPDTIFVIKDLIVLKNVSINILPLLMAGSQVLYQQFTTVTADPQQKMIMYLMPVIFIFIFWSMPSGVTLYWTVQNLFSIVWQLAVNKLSKDEPAAA